MSGRTRSMGNVQQQISWPLVCIATWIYWKTFLVKGQWIQDARRVTPSHPCDRNRYSRFYGRQILSWTSSCKTCHSTRMMLECEACIPKNRPNSTWITVKISLTSGLISERQDARRQRRPSVDFNCEILLIQLAGLQLKNLYRGLQNQSASFMDKSGEAREWEATAPSCCENPRKKTRKRK